MNVETPKSPLTKCPSDFHIGACSFLDHSIPLLNLKVLYKIYCLCLEVNIYKPFNTGLPILAGMEKVLNITFKGVIGLIFKVSYVVQASFKLTR